MAQWKWKTLQWGCLPHCLSCEMPSDCLLGLTRSVFIYPHFLLSATHQNLSLNDHVINLSLVHQGLPSLHQSVSKNIAYASGSSIMPLLLSNWGIIVTSWHYHIFSLSKPSLFVRCDISVFQNSKHSQQSFHVHESLACLSLFLLHYYTFAKYFQKVLCFIICLLSFSNSLS